jgi:hypothetical protein
MSQWSRPEERPERLHRAGAFVVQFRTCTDFNRSRVAGRIEHIASGHTANFESVTELLALIAKVLKDVLRDGASESEPTDRAKPRVVDAVSPIQTTGGPQW